MPTVFGVEVIGQRKETLFVALRRQIVVGFLGIQVDLVGYLASLGRAIIRYSPCYIGVELIAGLLALQSCIFDRQTGPFFGKANLAVVPEGYRKTKPHARSQVVTKLFTPRDQHAFVFRNGLDHQLGQIILEIADRAYPVNLG